MLSVALLAVATFFYPVTAAAQSASFSRTDYPLLGNNHIVADVNGDGIPDLAGSGTNSASIMLGNSNGTFGAKIEYAVAGQAQDLAAGDFNGDGKQDLAVTINDSQISLSLLIGKGDGTFNPPVNVENTSHLDSPAVVATDLDNDGKLDVVLAHSIACFTAPCISGRTITVLLGFGDGTFQRPWEIEVGTGMSRIDVGDFNRDGIKDLGIAGDRSQVFILLGVGNGTFLQQPTLTLTPDTFGVDATDIDVADLNGDTVEDLVVALPLNGSRTAIVIGNGDGTFRQPQVISEPGQRAPQYQVVADFNRDGKLDIAIALGWGSQGLMEILNGNGDGTFRLPVLYFAPPSKSSLGGSTLATGDFNRDGRPDIALPIVGASPGIAGLINSSGAASTPLAFGSVTATPASVVGGASTQITISLGNGAVAPAGGLSFSVTSSNSSVLTAPATVTMASGRSSVNFTANTRSVNTSQDVSVRVSNSQLGSRSVTVRVTQSAAPAPTPTPTPTPTPAVTLSAVTLTPGTVVGGNNVQGTVSLSRAASAATVVNLASSNARAACPATVTVPAGASSVSFNVSTTSVTSSSSAIITATLNGVTRNATLTINPAPAPTADSVSITRAEYDSSKRTLRIEATSTRSNATLEVFVTASGKSLGTLKSSGGGQYKGEISSATNPQNITVRSSLGGVATKSVTAR
jgi:hypothetical protein